MKKLTLIAVTVAFVGSVFAQGTVQFVNDPVSLTSPPDRMVRFAAANTPGNVTGIAGAPTVGTNFQVQLYYGAAGADPSTLVPVASAPGRMRASSTVSPGVWSSGGIRTLTGFVYGDNATPVGRYNVQLQVRVWDITDGTTFEAARLANPLGVFGLSQPFSYLMPASGSAPPADFFMTGFQSFTIGVVPEPSTMALAGLGAAALMILRRRK